MTTRFIWSNLVAYIAAAGVGFTLARANDLPVYACFVALLMFDVVVFTLVSPAYESQGVANEEGKA